jgi:hypothetical protein
MIGKNRLNVSGRRRFLGVAAGALATTQLATGQVANAGLVLDKPFKLAQSETPGSFSAVKQVDAGVLDVGYVEAGPTDGPTAILLHGWPYDIHSFDEVTPRLAAAGFHVIVPYARGYGSTSFLSNGTPRTGQPSALAVDTIALWTHSTSSRRPSPVSIGGLALPISSPHSGRIVSKALFR